MVESRKRLRDISQATAKPSRGGRASQKGAIIASAQEQDALADMVKGLTARHEALVDMLHFNGSISQEQASELKQEQWRGLVGEQRAREIWAQTRKVDDAEEYFEHYAKNEPRP